MPLLNSGFGIELDLMPVLLVVVGRLNVLMSFFLFLFFMVLMSFLTISFIDNCGQCDGLLVETSKARNTVKL